MPLQAWLQPWVLTHYRHGIIQQLHLGSTSFVSVLQAEVWTGYFLLLEILRGNIKNFIELVVLFFEPLGNRLKEKKLPKPCLPR